VFLNKYLFPNERREGWLGAGKFFNNLTSGQSVSNFGLFERLINRTLEETFQELQESTEEQAAYWQNAEAVLDAVRERGERKRAQQRFYRFSPLALQMVQDNLCRKCGGREEKAAIIILQEKSCALRAYVHWIAHMQSTKQVNINEPTGLSARGALTKPQISHTPDARDDQCPGCYILPLVLHRLAAAP
jgi:hypothetical protein